MKKLISLVLVALMVCMLAGCGDDRIMYASVNLEDYVKLSGYKDITIDTKSDEFMELYDSFIANDIETENLYVKKTEGTVSDGDTANIDYVGKKDGVAFEGGTAEGHDLLIGSNSFIEGFEEGLIGAEIGSTVELELTFPGDYNNAELAGKDVVFTVTVNYVTTSEELEPKDYYKELGFKSLKKYEEDVKNRAIDSMIFSIIEEKTEIKDYPKESVEFLKERTIETLEDRVKTTYNKTLDEYIAQSGMTQEEFDETVLEQQVYPLMDQTMPIYYILDQEKIKISKSDIDKKVDEVLEQYDDESVTAEKLLEYYGDYYFECGVADDKAIKVIRKYAKIK